MRTLQWVLPGGQVAPITAAQVDVCRQGGSCFSPAATTTSSSFSLPAEGAYTATIRLVDAAGNVGAVPATVALGWDTGAPPPPVLGSVQPNGGGTYLISVNTSNDPGPAPVASVVGEACPQSGGTCRSFVASGSPPSYATFDLPAAGLWMITARTVDAAGNTGPSAMTTYTVPAAATPTPTPTTPPTPGQSPAPSVSPQPTATTTPAFTVAPTETPTTTATATAAPRRRPGLRLTKARLTRTRVIVRGVIAADAAGAVSVSARGRTRALRIGGGSFAGSLRLPKRAYGAKRVRLTAAYVGDEAFLPRTRRQVLRRR